MVKISKYSYCYFILSNSLYVNNRLLSKVIMSIYHVIKEIQNGWKYLYRLYGVLILVKINLSNKWAV